MPTSFNSGGGEPAPSGGPASPPPGEAAPGYTWQYDASQNKWIQVALAAVGAIASWYGARQQNRASSGAGSVDMTTERTPWGPSDIYRQFVMDRGAQLMGMQDNYFAPVRYGNGQTIRDPGPSRPRPQGGVAGGSGGLKPFTPDVDPNPGAAGWEAGLGGKGAEGVGGRGGGPAGNRPGATGGRGGGPGNPGQKPPGGRGGRGGGGGQGQQQSGFNGVSPETDQIRQAMISRAQAGDPLYGTASNYITDTLSGNGDRNAYRGETADMLRNLDDPDLRRFKDMLFAGETPGSAAKGGSGSGRSSLGGAGVSYGYQAGSPQAIAAQAAASGTVGVDAALKKILAGEDAPGAEAMRARIQTASDKALNERLKANKLRAAGSGMYGATPYQNIEGQALSEYGTGLANELGALDYGLYGQALGLGTQYDIAAQDRAASERNAGAGASAAAYAADKDAETRMQLARMDALQGAIGQGLQQSQFRASGMGSLADLYSQDQRFALGAVPDISGLTLRDYGAAGSFSLGADSNRNAYLADRGRERVGLAGVGVQRAELNESIRRYDRETPLADLARYTDILNGASGGYGSTYESGNDRRNASPSQVNPWAQAIAGGAGGYSLGSQIEQSRR